MQRLILGIFASVYFICISCSFIPNITPSPINNDFGEEDTSYDSNVLTPPGYSTDDTNDYKMELDSSSPPPPRGPPVTTKLINIMKTSNVHDDTSDDIPDIFSRTPNINTRGMSGENSEEGSSDNSDEYEDTSDNTPEGLVGYIGDPMIPDVPTNVVGRFKRQVKSQKGRSQSERRTGKNDDATVRSSPQLNEDKQKSGRRGGERSSDSDLRGRKNNKNNKDNGQSKNDQEQSGQPGQPGDQSNNFVSNVVKAKTTGYNSIWLLGGNGTIMRCDWYGSSDTMPLVSDEDRTKLAKLELDEKVSNENKGKSGKKTPDELKPGDLPFKYLVCDYKSSGTGILIDAQGYPFLAMNPREFTKAFASAKYVPFPCTDDMGFFKKLDRWTSRVHVVLGSAFVGKLDDQLFFDSNADVVIMVATCLFAVSLAIWIGFIIKKLILKKKNDTFLPVLKGLGLGTKKPSYEFSYPRYENEKPPSHKPPPPAKKYPAHYVENGDPSESRAFLQADPPKHHTYDEVSLQRQPTGEETYHEINI